MPPIICAPVSPLGATKYEKQPDDRPERRRNERGDDHLFERGARDDVTSCRSPACRALHDAGDLAELAAHLFDDRAAGASDRLHRERANRYGSRPPMNRPQSTYGFPMARIRHAFDAAPVGAAHWCLMTLGRTMRRARPRRARGTDRVALRDGFGRVADRVERIGDVADLLRACRAISAMPPALSVIGPNESIATMMPAIESIAMTAMPTP